MSTATATWTPSGSNSGTTYSVGTFLNDGAGNFADPAPSGITNVDTGSNLVLADVDGDGDLDFATARSAVVSVRLNSGTGLAATSVVPVPAATAAPAGSAVRATFNQPLATSAAAGLRVFSARRGGLRTPGGNGVSVSGNAFTYTPPAIQPYLPGETVFTTLARSIAGSGGGLLVRPQVQQFTVATGGRGRGNFLAPATGASVALANAAQRVALGDINGDGKLDFVAANTRGATVSVRLNDGQGYFAAPATGAQVAAGVGAFGVALGDIDGDLDALTAGGNEVNVRLNNGRGLFGLPATGAQVPTNTSNGYQVVLGDVDADGDLDLLIASFRDNANAVGVRLNDGRGLFAPPAANAALALGDIAPGIALGDADGDNDLDLLAPIGNAVAVRLNEPAVPTLTVASPAAAGVGIPVTLTGTGLGSATGVTIGGTAATIAASAEGSLTFVVPASVVPGSFPVVVTTPGGSASLSYTVLAAPGNALAFDGSGDYVTLPASTVAALQNDFSLEYWVRTTQAGTGSSGGQWWQGTGLLDGEVTGPATDYGTSLLAGRVAFGVGNGTGAGSTASDVTVQSTTLVNDGRWHYVVATRQASTGTITLYVDGQPQATATGSTVARTAPPQLVLGSLQSTTSGSNCFAGSLDEVRLWSTVRTAQEVAAAYQAGPQTNFSQSGLVAYYSFDEGLPGGANADAAALYDLTSNAYHGALSGFALASGTTTSNFVASYALVVPTATAATSVTSTGFTANWTAPAVGNLDSYLLDVSTASDFTAPVAGSPFAVAASARSKSLAGLASGTTYYYRLRAELSSLTGQGAPSNAVVVGQPLPVALVAFTAERLGADGLLRWTTASEINNAYFELESSVDGLAFRPLARGGGRHECPGPPLPAY